MVPTSKPWWQQVTAVVSLGVGGGMTGFSFAPHPVADLTSPSGLPIRLMAIGQASQPAPAPDAALRSAIVNVAHYYLRLARGTTPAEMEALIWRHDSTDGADHGESCAAFASLTLELASHVVGQRSWVSGGTSYPWPLHKWADVRVDPNPASLGIVSIRQDAQAHHRWHPLGDGYQPLPGDWVLFDGHVEVVTSVANGVLRTIGGDSLPDFSVNAHTYAAPLAAQGVEGFVDNGSLAPGTQSQRSQRSHPSQPSQPSQPLPPGVAGSHGLTPPRVAGPHALTPPHAQPGTAPAHHPHRVADQPAGAAIPGAAAAPSAPAASSAGDVAIPGTPPAGGAAIPGTSSALAAGSTARSSQPPQRPAGPAPHVQPRRSGAGTAHATAHATAQALIPGLTGTVNRPSTTAAVSSPSRPAPPRSAASPPAGTSAEQAFINAVAPGAIAAQHSYGVPAAVTIAQAIDESGWGRSELAIRDHNLFGIKGTGPAGSDTQPTWEYVNGQPVATSSPFRVYHDIAESIDDHGRLLGTTPAYQHAMALRGDPDAFADALTGVYATDPRYGAKLIALMRQYDLYRYGHALPAPPHRARGDAAIPGLDSSGPNVAATAVRAVPVPRQPGGPARAGQHHRDHPRPATPPPSPAPTHRPPAPSPGPTRTMPPPPAGPRMNTPPPMSSPAAPRRTAQQSPPRRVTASTVTPARRSPGTQPRLKADTHGPLRAVAAPPRRSRRPSTSARYTAPLPHPVRDAFITTASTRLTGEEPLYRDVASHHGLPWELLAACDWMQCEAQPRYSPVHGERLGTVNPDGSVYRTKSEALEQCAEDLVEVAWAVYQVDLVNPGPLSIRELANAFAAFRWGGLLRAHRTSAMEFPYSVAGLTTEHMHMRWPSIDDPNTPDKPGRRFRMKFGAVPVVLSLQYPATV